MFTYMLSPLTSSTESGEAAGGQEQQQSHVQGGGSSGQDIAGWSLKLVMEYCDEVRNLGGQAWHGLVWGGAEQVVCMHALQHRPRYWRPAVQKLFVVQEYCTGTP